MKEQFSKITANPMGAVVGGAAVYFIGKRYITNNIMLGVATVAGVWLGAMAQAKFMAKKPTAADVKVKVVK